MYKKLLFWFISLCVLFFSCNQPAGNNGGNANNGGGGNNTAVENVTVNFFNESSYKVDIYKNINPSSSDTSTKPIVTVNPGSMLKTMQIHSTDQIVGDVFYIRYNVQLADAFSSGTGQAIYVQAERDISNIAFVLEANKTYTKTIEQPIRGQLKFINGYIKVQNTGSNSFQVLQGSTYLKSLGANELNVATGKFGFFALSIASIGSSEAMTNLKFFVTANAIEKTVPAFTLERGKVYAFECNGTNITGPTITDIVY